MKMIDAKGKQCPLPLMLAKKEIDAGCTDLAIEVDNDTAVKNLTRLGDKTGMTVSVDEIEGGFLVSLSGEGSGVSGTVPISSVDQDDSARASGKGISVFVGKDHVGEGDPELGYNLMKMALFTLSEWAEAPRSVLFMNSGVKLVAGEESQILESMQALRDNGCVILVCGTCLDFYGLKDSLKIGEVSNMYDILECMRESSSVISL